RARGRPGRLHRLGAAPCQRDHRARQGAARADAGRAGRSRGKPHRARTRPRRGRRFQLTATKPGDVMPQVLIIVFLTMFIILAIVGFAMEGLMWLGVVGVVLAVATLAVALVMRNRHRSMGRTA